MKSYRVWCPRCQALAINGTACHETGCPNSRQRWKRAFGYCYPENEELPEWRKEKDEDDDPPPNICPTCKSASTDCGCD